MSRPRLVAILGATGTGKTAAGIALAEALGGAVLNFDSRQIYEGLEVVTAQPDARERAHCPHLLYGFLSPCESISAGAYARLARQEADRLLAEGDRPILVGGTGLYLDAIMGGLAPIPEVDARIRKRVLEECDLLGAPTLHERLRTQDPEYAAKIHPNDRQRVTRALEVAKATGRTMTEWHRRAPEPRFDALKIGLRMNLDELRPRLARRIDRMLETDALEEVRAAFERCGVENAPGLTGIGCPELLDVVLGRSELDEAKEHWLNATRAYAKRQMTWFRRDPDVEWFDPDDHDAMIRRAREHLRS